MQFAIRSHSLGTAPFPIHSADPDTFFLAIAMVRSNFFSMHSSDCLGAGRNLERVPIFSKLSSEPVTQM